MLPPCIAFGWAAPSPFVSYFRVSTEGHGRSGLGLRAQYGAVAVYAAGQLVAEFQKVESGKRADRPQLAVALTACHTWRAVLVIAKLDRLARNARFLLSLVEGSSEGGVVFCDLPSVPAGPLARSGHADGGGCRAGGGLISQRAHAALAAAKAARVRLGKTVLHGSSRGRIEAMH